MTRDLLLAYKLPNNLQSAILLLVLAFLCAYLAAIIGGPAFAWIALIGVVLLYFGNPAVSPRMVMSLYRGRPLVPDEATRLYAVLREAGSTRPIAALLSSRELPRSWPPPRGSWKILGAFSGSGSCYPVGVSRSLRCCVRTPPTEERVKRLLDQREPRPRASGEVLYVEPVDPAGFLSKRLPLHPRWRISGLWY